MQKKIHAKEGDWEKKSCKRGREEKNYCRVNCTVGLTDCKRLNGNLVATLYCSFNFLFLVESQFTWFLLTLGKRTFLRSRLIHIVHSNFIMGVGCQTSLQKNHGLNMLKVIKKNMSYIQPSCLIRLQLSKHILCFESLDIIKEWFHNRHV